MNNFTKGEIHKTKLIFKRIRDLNLKGSPKGYPLWRVAGGLHFKLKGKSDFKKKQLSTASFHFKEQLNLYRTN